MSTFTALPGQETLVACWRTLAQMSAGARLIRSSATVAAVFPTWTPLNNAIMLTAAADAGADAVSELTRVYGDAGVAVWALWVPSPARDLDMPDDVRAVGRLERDTTTLVMQATLRRGLRLHDGVIRTSIATVTRVGTEAVPVADLGEPDETPGLSAWVLVHDAVAVACAWSFLHENDCGIYAVGTLPQWRRRGLQSTRIGQEVYASLGFAPVGRYEEWISQ